MLQTGCAPEQALPLTFASPAPAQTSMAALGRRYKTSFIQAFH